MTEIGHFGAVLGEAARIARRSSGWMIGTAVAVTLTYLAADMLVPDPYLIVAYGVLGFFAIYLQLLLMAHMLSVSGLADYQFNPKTPTDGRFASAFLLSLLTAVAIFAGLILLVIPGLILLARWGVCFPVLLAERATVNESLGRSWRMTGRRWKVATLVMIVILFLSVPAFVSVHLLYPTYGTPTFAAALLTNVLFSLAWVLSWLMSAAFYVWMRQAEAAHDNLANDRSLTA